MLNLRGANDEKSLLNAAAVRHSSTENVELNLECRDAIVPVLRALQHVYATRQLTNEILELMASAIRPRMSLVNLQAHVDIIHRFGVPVIVAINRFPSDTDGDINLLKELANDMGVEAIVIEPSHEWRIGNDQSRASCR